MNIQEMHISFLQAVEKLDTSSFPEFLVEQVDYILNEAIKRFVKLRYGRNNIYKQGVEEIQKRTDDLRSLVITEFPSITSSAIYSNTYIASLSTIYTDINLSVLSTNKYWFFLNGEARVNKSNCTQFSIVHTYNHNELSHILKNPFKKPNYQEVVGYWENGNLLLVTDGTFTIDRLRLTYLKKPAEVRFGANYPSPVSNIDCDLPEHTHNEIIQLAVAIALENVESMRLQQNIMFKNLTEE